MAKVGKASGKSGGGGAGEAPALNSDLVRRANEAGTVVDYGDATSRAYNKNADEISKMDMTQAEKAAAYSRLHELTEKQLEAESQARGAYAAGMGPARFDSQAVKRNQEKAVAAGDNVRSFMNGLKKEQEKKSAQKKRETEAQAMTKAMSNAQKSGSLEVSVNGKTYFRTNKKSATWREGTLKEHKAQQKFLKEQKNVPFTKRKSWSSLSASEKNKYY